MAKRRDAAGSSGVLAVERIVLCLRELRDAAVPHADWDATGRGC